MGMNNISFSFFPLSDRLKNVFVSDRCLKAVISLLKTATEPDLLEAALRILTLCFHQG